MYQKYSYFVLLLLIPFGILTAKDNELSFIKNVNQWESPINYKADIPGGALFLTPTKMVYSFYKSADLERIHELKHKNKNVNQELVSFHAYDVNFVGANSNPTISALKQQTTYHNYFLGNDNQKWASHVPLFGNIQYTNIYNGINLSVYSKEQSIKYDFIVSPNANPYDIRLNFNGVKPQLKPNGDLFIKTSVNEITELAPYAYQTIQGKEVGVPCKFQLKNNELTYEFPNGYDKNYTLTIDPILVFSTYSGSTATTYGFSATYDALGSLYAGGECFSVGWPSTVGAFQLSYGGGVDAGLNKYTPNGSTLIYSTYYGGSASDLPNNLVVNSNNELIVCGSTSSSNLPVTAGCYDNTLGGSSDIYVAHFNNTGTALIGATYVGGSGIDGQNSFALSPNYGDANRGEVYVDANQDILCAVSTQSNNFPTTAGCFQNTFGGAQDGCIFKLNPTCTNLIYSTYLGGADNDACFAISVNSTNKIVVTGGTMSTNFPTTAGSLHPTNQGGTDGFAAILNNTMSTLDFSTYLGTAAFDHGFKLQLDGNDNVYICGQSDGAYPITPGMYTNANGGIFIDILNPTLSASLGSTIIGQAAGNLVPTAFLYDNCGNIYFSGFQAQPGLPLTANAHQTTPGGFWLCVLANTMTQLMYATYMGASGDHVDGGTSRFDPAGIIYQSVCTASANQYNSAGSWSPTNQAASWDVASFKFDFEATGVNANCILTPNTDSACTPASITFINNTTNATNYIWDFGDGSPTSTAVNPTHIYTSPGTFTVQLIAYNPNACVTSDTSYVDVHIFQIATPIILANDTTFCDPNALLILDASILNANNNMNISWQPSNGIISGGNTLNPLINPAVSMSYTIIVTDSVSPICKEVAQATINVTFGDTTKFKVHPIDTTVCEGERVYIVAEGGNKYTWSPNANIVDIHAPTAEIFVYNPITYSVLIEDAFGCKATRYTNLNVFPKTQVDAGQDEIIRYNETIQLNASGVNTYNWQNDPTLSALNIANPTGQPTAQTIYYVTGVDINGCLSKDSVTIYVTNGIIPNAFTPNGDGINDEFKFKKANPLLAFKSLRIYNRWGQEVFYSTFDDIGWNGEYKGTKCEVGSYYYLVEYAIGQRSFTEKGDISLLR